MKKLFLMATLLAAFSVTAQKIEPVQIGIKKIADSVSVTVMPFKTTDKFCGLYYQIFDKDKNPIDDGNLQLTEKEFIDWGDSNVYIEDLALLKLEFKRKPKIETAPVTN